MKSRKKLVRLDWFDQIFLEFQSPRNVAIWYLYAYPVGGGVSEGWSRVASKLMVEVSEEPTD